MSDSVVLGASGGKSAADSAVLGTFGGRAALDSTALGELGGWKLLRRRWDAEAWGTFGGFDYFKVLGFLVDPRTPVEPFV